MLGSYSGLGVTYSSTIMTNGLLSRIRIVLVEPAGSLNLGSIARAMKNMGLTRLVLVNPQCHPDDDDARLMAVHAGDVLQAAQQVNTLPDALAGCHRAVATTARDRDILDSPLEHPRHVLPWLLGMDVSAGTASEGAIESALIFGPEDRGLSNTELSYAQRCLRIPTSPMYSSLNLAQAVAICCYELYQLAEAASPAMPPAQSDRLLQPADQEEWHPAVLDDLEGLYQHLEETLLHIGYVYPHTADSRMKKFRRMVNRTTLTTQEVSMLRGILRQIKWAMEQPTTER